MMPVALEEAGRDRDLQLGGQRLHRPDRGMVLRRAGQREQRLVFDLAEIGAGEQLGRKHHLGALGVRVGHGDVDVQIGQRARVRVDGLREVARAVDVPIVAIGGVTLDNAPLAIRAGASGVSVISAILFAPDSRKATEDLTRTVRTALAERTCGK